jgi:hypothetical protein
MADHVYLPPDAHPNILSTLAPDPMINIMFGKPIPDKGPHTKRIEQFGFKILEDFSITNARVTVKKGQEGHLIEFKDTPEGKMACIHIRGVTGQLVKGVWVNTSWVPARIVAKGKRWE